VTPQIITEYFEHQTDKNTEKLVACFTSDASVTDEGKTMIGHPAIRAWKEGVAAAFDYTVSVAGTEHLTDEKYAVTAQIEGNFPGSPVRLHYRFTLRDNLIAELIIAP
jgi:hypothetical protein